MKLEIRGVHNIGTVTIVNENNIVKAMYVDKPDAEYICKAVNNHERLMETLEMLKMGKDPKTGHRLDGTDKFLIIQGLLKSIEGE